jgi:predicted transglutaminase-like cysteine proteinase|tara:strand:- start:2685 stop:3047 length:363 start_codon:yes stop_codon:yes gene_type:complete
MSKKYDKLIAKVKKIKRDEDQFKALISWTNANIDYKSGLAHLSTRSIIDRGTGDCLDIATIHRDALVELGFTAKLYNLTLVDYQLEVEHTVVKVGRHWICAIHGVKRGGRYPQHRELVEL